MQLVNKRLFHTTLLLIALFGCQPAGKPHSAQYKKTQSEPIIEAPVDVEPAATTSTSTWDEAQQKMQDAFKTKNIVYQKPEEKIKNNSTTEIHLGKVKLENLKIVYNREQNKLTTSGDAVIIDENKKEISRDQFSLIGSHPNNKNEFYLRSDIKLKTNSLTKPVTRAKVTCLAINENDEVECSHAIVDFFIAYNKKIYTEQIEINKKISKPKPIAPVPPIPVKNPETGDHDENDEDDVTTAAPAAAASADITQTEGKEDSILGRFQGQAETANLKEVFEDTDDDDIEKEPTPPAMPALAPLPNSPTPTASVDATAPPVVASTDTTKPPTAVVKPPQVITNDIIQTAEGILRPVNQAIGLPFKGSLRNATSVLEKQKTLNEKAFFEVASPERNRHFATYEMSEILSRVGNFLKEKYEKKLFVGNISQKKGGLLPPHASHQIGMDADLAYPATRPETKFPVVVQMSTRQYSPSVYSVEKTYQLFKYTFMQPDIKVDRIFTDRTIKKALCEYATAQGEFNGKDKEIVKKLFEAIDHVDGHGDHFHLRIKCSASDPGCRNIIYSVNKGCS